MQGIETSPLWLNPNEAEKEPSFPFESKAYRQEIIEPIPSCKLRLEWCIDETDMTTELKLLEAKVRTLVEKGNIAEARKELSKVPVGSSRVLDKWRKVLVDPVVKRVGTASGKHFKEDFRWIKQHSVKYKGQWVALNAGEFLGSNRSRLILHQQLKREGKLSGATFLKVEE